jgi:methionyl aminopeptidase
MIGLKSERELAIMRKASGIVAETLSELHKIIRPKVKTIELDQFCEWLIKKRGGKSAFKDYKGFPANICTSVNEVIVHGIPSDRVLCNGDIISVDVGVEIEGYFGDGAFTYAVGAVDEKSKRLIEVTKAALEKSIENACVGKRISAISCAIQEFVESNGFNVIRAFVGHGIGSKLHEPPEIPNFGTPDTGVRLESGMVLAIEPMVSVGKYEVEILGDGWTAVTVDRSRVAHFEHTVVITNDGPEVLTLCQKKNLSRSKAQL